MKFVEVEIDLVVTSTRKAILISKDDEETWIPRVTLSQCTDDLIITGKRNQVIDTIKVDDWFAKQQGWG